MPAETTGRLSSCSPSDPKTATCSGTREALLRLKGHRAWVGPALLREGTPLTPHGMKANNKRFTNARNSAEDENQILHAHEDKQLHRLRHHEKEASVQKVEMLKYDVSNRLLVIKR